MMGIRMVGLLTLIMDSQSLTPNFFAEPSAFFRSFRYSNTSKENFLQGSRIPVPRGTKIPVLAGGLDFEMAMPVSMIPTI